jgi:hypothetical protein
MIPSMKTTLLLLATLAGQAAYMVAWYGSRWLVMMPGPLVVGIWLVLPVCIAGALCFRLVSRYHWMKTVRYREVLAVGASTILPLLGMYVGFAWSINIFGE